MTTRELYEAYYGAWSQSILRDVVFINTMKQRITEYIVI